MYRSHVGMPSNGHITPVQQYYYNIIAGSESSLIVNSNFYDCHYLPLRMMVG